MTGLKARRDAATRSVVIDRLKSQSSNLTKGSGRASVRMMLG